MAISISILIVVIGLISLFSLPVEQYPDIAPPTVQVSATYTGADAEAVMNSVIMPLEESINGVEDMMYITSTATNAGTATIEVYFKQGTDPDMAAVNVQNRVSKAQGLLPAEVTKIGVTTQKRQTSFLQINALASTDGRYDKIFLGNYMDINVIPQIKRVEGVGDVMMLGDTYSMRIWLHPERMAQYGLVPSDVTAVLGEQNIEAPTGSLGENSKNVFQFTMKYRGRLKSVDEFRNTVVRAQADGSVLRLKDVADVELGTQTYSFSSEMDGKPAVMFIVFQTAGSNATAVNESISKKMKEMEKDLPQGTEFVNMMSSNDFLFASIHNVVETLVIAIILVVLVVYFFLQDFKSTLIPSISIIVSLIGTFACLMAAGFSINILTLFALVLAIGTVVDDAIVVVEAVQSKFDVGYKSSYLATKDAMGDVTMAIISCTCVFMAVFIPVTFTGGTSGIFYTQFGITMATSVGISMISALTLCPALCAIMMRPSDGTKSAKSINGRVRAAYNASFNAVLGKYKKGVLFFIRHRWMVWASLAITTVLLVYFMGTTKTGLVPQEDQGVIMVNIATSPGSTLEETNKVMNKLEDILKKTPEIEHYSRVAGYGFLSGQGTSYGLIVIRLRDWSERKGNEHTSDAVVARLNAQFYQIKDAQIFSFQPGMIPGYGMGNSIELNLQDRTGGDMTTFYNSVMQFLGALNQHPEVAMAYTSYAMNFPQGRGFPSDLPLPPEADWSQYPLADVRAFSIDDSDTTEVDDAASVVHLEGGRTRVGIHIAAPALGILRDDPLDKVARARMSTVYAPGLKTTMLPDPWIKAFSLDEGRAVPCLSLYVTVDDETFSVEKTETRLERVSVTRNLRYDKIDSLVTEEAIQSGTLDVEFADEICWLWRFAKKLQKDREEVRGRPEPVGRVDWFFALEGEGEDALIRVKGRRRGAPLDLLVAELMIFRQQHLGPLDGGTRDARHLSFAAHGPRAHEHDPGAARRSGRGALCVEHLAATPLRRPRQPAPDDHGRAWRAARLSGQRRRALHDREPV